MTKREEDTKLLWDYLIWRGQNVSNTKKSSIRILSSLGNYFLISFTFGDKEGFFKIIENNQKSYEIVSSSINNGNYTNPYSILDDLTPLFREIKLNSIL